MLVTQYLLRLCLLKIFSVGSYFKYKITSSKQFLTILNKKIHREVVKM